MSFGIFQKKEKQAARPSWGCDNTPKVAEVSRADILRVGTRVRGADVVPDSYETVNRYFRGTIVDFDKNGINDVRVKMDGTKRIFRVQAKYLRAV